MLFAGSLLLIASFFLWIFIFSIYEVKFEKVQCNEDGKIFFEIRPVTLNLMGFSVPFRNIEASYKVSDTDFKVSQYKKGVVRIECLNEKVSQKVEIVCSTEFNLFPELINLSFKK